MLVAAAQLDYRLQLIPQLKHCAELCRSNSVDVVVLPEMLNMPAVVRGYKDGFGPLEVKQGWWDKAGDWLARHPPSIPWLGLHEAMDEALYEQVIRNVSKDSPKTYIVGGSVVVKREDGLYNVGVVAYDGEVVARYDKLNPIHVEKMMGVKTGKLGPACIPLDGIGSYHFPDDGRYLHAAICYDIEFVDQWKHQPLSGDIVAIPSWGWRPEGWSETEYDLQFVDTARHLGVVLVRCFWAGDMPLGRMGGNSAIVVPDKPLLRASLTDGQFIGAKFESGRGGFSLRATLRQSTK